MFLIDCYDTSPSGGIGACAKCSGGTASDCTSCTANGYVASFKGTCVGE